MINKTLYDSDGEDLLDDAKLVALQGLSEATNTFGSATDGDPYCVDELTPIQAQIASSVVIATAIAFAGGLIAQSIQKALVVVAESIDDHR